MKKILIFLLIISLFLLEGCSVIGYGVGSGIYKEDLPCIEEIESTDINEPANQPAEKSVLQNISFQAKENPYIVVYFQYQQIEGLLMGMEADSILLKNEQSSLVSQIQPISINEIHHIRVIRKSKSGEYFVYGLLIGAVTGVVIGLANGDVIADDPFQITVMTAEELAFYMGGGLGLLGGFIGAITGAGAGRDQRYDLSEQSYFKKIEIIRKLSGYEQ